MGETLTVSSFLEGRNKTMLTISAIIMASGQSSRMGHSKLFLPYRDKTFLEHTLILVENLPFYERILVLKSGEKELAVPSDVKLIENHLSDTGQSASVRIGTYESTAEAYMYLPIDQPLLSKELCLPLMKKATRSSIVFPTNKDGKHFSPIIFGAEFRDELLNVSGKFGGRDVKLAHKEAWLPVSFSSVSGFYDVDTPEEYQELLMLKDE